jgi:hypothetical protein
MRQIIEEDSFTDAAVQLAANYEKIDLALDTIKHGLMINPFAYRLHETQITSFRFAITERVNWKDGTIIPRLTVIFTIDQDENVHLIHIETFES